MDNIPQASGNSSQVTPFETNQINVATFLMCRGHMPTGRRQEGKRIFFQFVGGHECEKLQEQFLLGDDLVSARAWTTNYANLKRIIFDG